MVLGSVFSPDLIKIGLESEDKDEVFEELVDLYVSSNAASSGARQGILDAIRDREEKLSTGIKPGIAIPHAQTDEVSGVRGIIGISRAGIDYDALDGKPVHVIFLLLASSEGCALHLRSLKRLSILLDNPDFIPTLLAQKDSGGVYATLCKFESMLASSL
ncbi:MAG TPA: PTS sugar transporter subunit IIA [Treponemataceae bacterium]|nr:PTS sugar transporter subunit IIA [Treponemataceae bacterium]HPS44067.1 PTS sugar transporter subunit IIA [Treponemataceae bacterium]